MQNQKVKIQRPIPSDDDLKGIPKKIVEYKQGNGWTEISQQIFHMSVKKFYDNFFSNEALFGLDEFSKRVGRWDINY